MNAMTVLQAYLGRLARALMTCRFDEYLACVRLPVLVETAQAKLEVSTEGDLADGFDALCDMLHSRGVNEARLVAHQAVFDGPDKVVGLYESCYLGDGKPVVPHFFSRIWLDCRDGIWASARFQNTTGEPRWPILLTRVDPGQCLSRAFKK